jgi:Mor family transcriptional regulator
VTSPAAADDLISAVRQVVAWALERHGADPAAASTTAAEACRELCRCWGGAEYWIPSTYRPARNADIVAAAREGMPVATISRQLAVSEATVRRVVRRQSAGLGSDEWVL